MFKYIIEGADGVGKTETINRLERDNIICQDRCKDVISKYMEFDIDVKKRVEIYYKYFYNSNHKVIFLINNDKKEMMRRISSRKNIDDYDLLCNEYNDLYLKTYNYMLEKNILMDKFYMIDVTNLDINEQVNKVKKLIKDE